MDIKPIVTTVTKTIEVKENVGVGLTLSNEEAQILRNLTGSMGGRSIVEDFKSNGISRDEAAKALNLLSQIFYQLDTLGFKHPMQGEDVEE